MAQIVMLMLVASPLVWSDKYANFLCCINPAKATAPDIKYPHSRR